MKMRKLVTTILLIAIMMGAVSALADGNTAVVISNSISIRVEPKTSATKLFTAKNGNELVIAYETGDWYCIDLKASGFNSDYEFGFVRKDYVVTGGYYIILNKTAYLYDSPWSTKRNGERVKGDRIFVKGEHGEWLIVQTTVGSAGTSFIRKSEVDFYYEQPQEPEGYVVPETVTGRWMVDTREKYTVGIRQYTNLMGEVYAYIHSGDEVEVIDVQGNFAYVRYLNSSNQYIYGWVATKYFVPIY